MRTVLLLLALVGCNGGDDPRLPDAHVLERPPDAAPTPLCRNTSHGGMACSTWLCCLNGNVISIESCQVGSAPPCEACKAPFTSPPCTP